MIFYATVRSAQKPTPQAARLDAPSQEAAVKMLERQGYTVLAIAAENVPPAAEPPPQPERTEEEKQRWFMARQEEYRAANKQGVGAATPIEVSHPLAPAPAIAPPKAPENNLTLQATSAQKRKKTGQAWGFFCLAGMAITALVALYAVATHSSGGRHLCLVAAGYGAVFSLFSCGLITWSGPMPQGKKNPANLSAGGAGVFTVVALWFLSTGALLVFAVVLVIGGGIMNIASEPSTPTYFTPEERAQFDRENKMEDLQRTFDRMHAEEDRKRRLYNAQQGR